MWSESEIYPTFIHNHIHSKQKHDRLWQKTLLQYSCLWFERLLEKRLFLCWLSTLFSRKMMLLLSPSWIQSKTWKNFRLLSAMVLKHNTTTFWNVYRRPHPKKRWILYREKMQSAVGQATGRDGTTIGTRCCNQWAVDNRAISHLNWLQQLLKNCLGRSNNLKSWCEGVKVWWNSHLIDSIWRDVCWFWLFLPHSHDSIDLKTCDLKGWYQGWYQPWYLYMRSPYVIS